MEKNPITQESLMRLFNLSAVDIQDFHVGYKDTRLLIDITLSIKAHSCPICQSITTNVKGYTSKKLKHSIIANTICIINYKARRHQCHVCNKTFYENNPFVFHNMKVSAMTVYNVLTDLKSANETFCSVANRYEISSTAVASIFDSFVSVSRSRLPKYLCIDEVYAFHGSTSDYICVLLDFETQSAVDILPSRRKDYLINYFSYIPRHERLNVEMVSIDMWHTYRDVTKIMFPNAKCAVDKLHVIQDLHKRVDRIRIRIMNELKTVNDIDKRTIAKSDLYEYEKMSKHYYVLKKFSWTLFKTDEQSLDPNNKKRWNTKLQQYCNFYDLRAMILNEYRELDAAVNLKDRFQQFYKSRNIEQSETVLHELINDFRNSESKEMNKFGEMITNWKYEILNSLIPITVKSQDKDGKHLDKVTRINNGIIENKNKIIKQLKRNGNGYRNWERFRNRVLYVLNPETTYRIDSTISEKGGNRKLDSHL